MYENVLYEHELFSSTNIFLLSLKIYFDRVRFLRLYASNARRKLSCLILSFPLFFSNNILTVLCAACAGNEVMLCYYVSRSRSPEYLSLFSLSLTCACGGTFYIVG